MKDLTANSELIYNRLTSKIKRVWIKELYYNYINSIIILFASALFSGLGLILTGVFFNPGSIFRTIASLGYSGLFLSGFIYFTLVFIFNRFEIFQKFNPVSYSGEIGSFVPEVSDNLSNSLSLFSKLNSNSYYSERLIISNLKKAGEKYSPFNLANFIPFDKIKRKLLVPFSLIVIISFLFILFPNSLFPSLKKFINYNLEYLPDGTGISFEVIPGNTKAVIGSNVQVYVKIVSDNDNFNATNLKLSCKRLDLDGNIISVEESVLSPVDNNLFKDTILANSEIKYFAELQGIKSPVYKITLEDYPALKSFKFKIFPPAYTNTKPYEIKDETKELVCPEGSRIEASISSNKILSSASVNIDNQSISLQPKDENASGSFIANHTGKFNFILKDSEGNINNDYNIFNLKVIPDEAPKVSIIEPSESNFELRGKKEILLRAKISDDYGFRALTLNFKKVKQRTSASVKEEYKDYFGIIDVPIINKTATSLEIPYLWNLILLLSKSGDAVDYYLEVTDNSGKTGRSEIKRITFKTAADVIKETEKYTKEIQKNLKSVFDDTKNLEKELAELRKNLQKGEETGVNEMQKKNELKEKIDRVQNNMQAIQEKIDAGIQDIKQNNSLSEKVLDQFMKMQEQFNKINTPQFQDMLRKLQEALKKNNPQEIQRDLKNINFDEEAFRKQLEKIMELMKKIENLQKFGELTKELEELLRKQEEIKMETMNTQNSDNQMLNQLSKKQSELKENVDKISESIDEFKNELKKDKDDISTDGLEQVSKNMKSKNLKSKMQKSSEQLQKGEKSSSEETQDDILKDLNELNEMMQDALENEMNSDESFKKMLDKMKQMKSEIEELSKDQGELKEKTGESDEKEEFGENQKEQKELQTRLTKTIDDLFSLTKNGLQVTPEMGKELGNAYNKMDKANQDLQSESKNNAMSNQQSAKNSLDNAAKILGDMINSMSQQGKPGNKPGGRMAMLMEKLAQLIKLQQGMNGQIQQLGEDGKKGEKGKDGENGKVGQDGKEGKDSESMKKDMIDRLKIQQENIKKSLEELSEEFEKEKQRNNEQFLGDLGKVAEEMQQLIKDLSEYKIDEKTTERQNKILSRMLEFQLSQREKDFEQKRESRPGENFIRSTPPEIIIAGPNSFNALKEDYLRLQREGFTKEYEELIMDYLKSLKVR
jgi:hypothetical protein